MLHDAVWNEATSQKEYLPRSIVVPLGGRYHIDDQADDLSGMGILGPYYVTQVDMGGLASTNLNRTAGGFMFPFDVRIDRVFMDFYQSVADMGVNHWGWLISRVERTRPGNDRETTFVYDERSLGVRSAIDSGWTEADGNNRDYGNNQNQYMDLDLSDEANNVVPSLEVINFSVFHEGTANANNRYIYNLSGFMMVTRV